MGPFLPPRRAVISGALGLASVAPARAANSEEAVDGEFVAEVRRLAETAGGVFGVSMIHLESGRRVSLRGVERFPMASTLKIAVAGALLARADAGQLKLDALEPVPAADFVPGSIITTYLRPGVSLSLANLLELMLVHSDNTATDVLMRVIGGPAAATAWLRAQGVRDQRVDRNTLEHMRSFFGFGPGPYAQASAALAAANPDFWELAQHPNVAYDRDPRDTTTPDAMAELLARIARGQAVSAASSRLLLGIMSRCQTGPNRLPALLPRGASVAYKTGTMGGSVNAVGVITLPASRGRLVIAAYIRESDLPRSERERAIAEVARLAYDYFTTRSV